MSDPCSEARLEWITGGKTCTVNLGPGSVCHIGRDEQNTLVLRDNQVSRKHAMVQCGPAGDYLLADLGSRNGTWVNQRRVTSLVALKTGDRINIGSHELVFHGPAGQQPAAAPAQGETVVEFVQRLITVLVVDIRDFTGLSSRLAEARLSELVSTFMRESGIVLARESAWAQKYIGDAVMAVWLHSSDQPTSLELLPVFRSLERIVDIASRLHVTLGLDAPIRVGAGVNTGVACVGNMGSDASSDYTALSDAVNLAFRLESATKEIGQDIALGQKTYACLAAQSGGGSLFRQHTVNLKGYREPKPVYGIMHGDLGGLLEAIQRGGTQDTGPGAGEQA